MSTSWASLFLQPLCRCNLHWEGSKSLFKAPYTNLARNRKGAESFYLWPIIKKLYQISSLFELRLAYSLMVSLDWAMLVFGASARSISAIFVATASLPEPLFEIKSPVWYGPKAHCLIIMAMMRPLSFVTQTWLDARRVPCDSSQEQVYVYWDWRQSFFKAESHSC